MLTDLPWRRVLNIAYTLVCRGKSAEEIADLDRKLASIEEQRRLDDEDQDAVTRAAAAQITGKSGEQLVAEAAARRRRWANVKPGSPARPPVPVKLVGQGGPGR